MDKLLRNVCALILTTAMMLGIMQGPLTWAFANGKDIDLATVNWEKSITVLKESNGKETKIDENTVLKDKDKLDLHITYKIPAGGLPSSDTKVTYKLPAGVVTEADYGSVKDGATTVGHYTISTDGKIEISFNPDINLNVEHVGTFSFEGTIDQSAASNSGSNSEIAFAGLNTKIKLDDNNGNKGGDNTGGSGSNPGGNTTPSVNHDLQVKKSSKQSNDKKKIYYTVVASTNNGTGSVVNLYDSFQNVANADPKYERGSFKLVKKTSEKDRGQSVDMSNKLVFGTNNNLEKFGLTNLPALNAGESYVLTYTADVNAKSNSNGEVKVGNGITAKKGNDWGGSDYKGEQISKPMIDKSGSYDKGEIKWEVTINEDQRDLNDYTFDDNLPYKLTCPYQVYCGNNRWNTNEEMSSLEKGKAGDTNIHIAFKGLDDNHKNKVYKVVYYTEAPEVSISDGKKTVNNTVKLTDGKGNGYSSNKDVDVYPYTFSVQKAASEQKMNGDHASYTWTPTMNLSGNKATSFIYKDIIEDPTYDGKKDTDDTSDYHYADIKDLKEAISKSLTVKHKDDHGNEVDYDRNAYTWTLKCYDAKNNEINENDNDAKVKSFTLEVSANHAEDFRPTSASIVYQTIGDLSRVMPGQKWDFKNSGLMTKYNGHDIDEGHTKKGDSHYEYENKKALTKLASATGDPGSYTNGVLDVYKTKSDNATDENKYLTEDTIHYRILLNVNKDQKGPLTVTDTLPKGMRYKEGSMKVQFYNGDNDLKPTNYKWIQSESRQFSFENEETKPTLKQSENSDKQAVLTFTIPGGFENDHDQQIAIDYEGIVTDDPAWKDMTIEKKSYTNSVKWDNHEDSQTTNVKRPVKVVTKSVEQVKEDGKLTNQLEYSVDINPAGKVLNKGNPITLSDVLTVQSGSKAYLDLQNVKLYKFDPNAEKHHGNTVIDPSLYHLKYDDITNKMSVELPDATPCVLVYRYTIDRGYNTDPTVSNSAELAGNYSDSQNTKLEKVKSSSTLTSGITVRKVDAGNITKGLARAQFKVEIYGDSGWTDCTNDVYVKDENDKPIATETDVNGKLPLNNFTEGKLYRIQETKAPDNYSLSSTYYYFMITDNADKDGEKTLYDSLPSQMRDQKDHEHYVKKDDIHFFGKNGGEIIVPDKSTKLIINKTWLNADGTKASVPGANSVNMTLYRYEKKLNGYSVKVKLRQADNQWAQWQEFDFNVEKDKPFTASWTTNNTNGIKVARVNGKDISDQIKDKYKFSLDKVTQDTTIELEMVDYFQNTEWEYTKAQIAKDETSKPKTVNFTLQADKNPEENWSKTFDNLPVGNDGVEYVYEVEENTKLSDYDSTVSAKDISSGTITVANRRKPDAPKTPETVLPSTGGKGTTMFYVAGVLLILVASILLIRKYKHLNERG